MTDSDTPRKGPAAEDGTRGRRPSTTRAAIARAAFELFAQRGFDATTVDEIAAAAGISRRTFFRYYESKSDVAWGEFASELARLHAELDRAPAHVPMMDVLREAVVATNQFGPDELEVLRMRIGLVSSVPALVAHSAVLYNEWCDVVSGFVAERLGGHPDDLGPQTVARAALGAASAAFTHWAQTEGGNLAGEVDQAFRLLATGFAGSGRVGQGGGRSPGRPGR